MTEWHQTPQVVAVIRANCGTCGRRLEANVYRLTDLEATDRRVTAAIQDHKNRCGGK